MVVGQDLVGIGLPFRSEFGGGGAGDCRGSDAGDRLDLGLLEDGVPVHRLVVERVVVGEGVPQSEDLIRSSRTLAV